MPSVSMLFDVIARDNASGSFRRISAEAGGAAASFDKVGKAAAGMTLLLGAFAVNAAAKFESSMARINTQAGVPLKQIKGLSEAILNLAPKVGVGPDQLAVSLYHVESAFRTTGISAQKALDIVKAASQLSRIGHADLESTTQAVIGTLASGIKGVKDAADAAAQINQLVGTGDTTLAAVTKAVATGILPTAQTLGLSFKDVAAALATLTDNATPADEAATRLRTTLSLVENPGGKAKAALESVGLSSVQLANDFRQPNGLLVALKDLKSHLDVQYPLTQKTALSTDQVNAAAKAYTTQLLQQGTATKEAVKLGDAYANSLKKGGTTAVLQAQTILSAFGGARSGSTFLTLFNELDRLQSKYKDFGTSAQAAAKFQDAWAVQQTTAKQKLDQLKASWDVFLIRIGNAILPDLKRVVDVLAKHPGILKAAAAAVASLGAAWVAVKLGGVIASIGRLVTGLGALAIGARAAAGAEGIAGIEGAAGGASRGLSGMLTAAKSSGLLAGGVIVGGLIGIGAAIKEIMNDADYAIPSVNDLATALGKAAEKTPGQAVNPAAGHGLIAQSLTQQKSGDNRGENIADYLSRNFNNLDLKSGKTYADLYGVSLSKLYSVIQTGNKGDLAEFQEKLIKIEHALKASPDTIGNVDAYLSLLFRAFNKAKDAADGASGALALSSTNADKLAKEYHLTATQANVLADANSAWAGQLQYTNDFLAKSTKTLDVNTSAGSNNHWVLVREIQAAKEHAQAVLDATGSQYLSTQAFNTGAAAIEANAVKLGFNKQQVDFLLYALGQLPPSKTVPVNTPGAKESAQDVYSLWTALNNLKPVYEVVIHTSTSGVPVSSITAQINQAAGIGLGVYQNADGGIYRSKVPGGVFQWAEDGGESFIPHDPAKRPRALSILKETARILGVTSMANGAINPGVAAALAEAGLSVGPSSSATKAAKAPAKTASEKLADKEASAFLKSLAKSAADIAKFGVKLTEKTVTSNFTAAGKAIAEAVKQGNGPLQRSLAGRLKAAESALYGTATSALRDGTVSPLENLAVAARAKAVATLTAALVKLNTVNQQTIDRLQNFVQAQTQFRDSLKSSLQQGNTFSDILSHSGTIGDVKTLLAGKLSELRNFATKMNRLRKAGWSDAVIREIASDGIGPAVQYADLLLGASKSDKSFISAQVAALGGGQTATANFLTAATGGSPGLSNSNAFSLLNKAIYAPGANQAYWISQAEKAQRTQGPTRTAPLVGVQNVYGGNYDLELKLKQAQFLERTQF